MKFISKFVKKFKSKISCAIEKLRQIAANTKIVSKNGQTRADLVNF